MPAKIAQLEIDFITNLAKFSDDMKGAAKEAESTARKIQSTMERAWQGIAVAGVSVGIGTIFNKMIENTAEAEDAMAQVQASLRSTGGAAGVTAQSVSDLSQKMKELTALDDDAVTGMQSVLLTFTKVGKEVFPAATQAIADMSVKMGIDLKGAAVQVGKALNDPVKGITALRKEGVAFTAAQEQMIKNMVSAGRTMDAQKMILRELQTEFGGSAAAARDTMGGAVKALEVRVGDLFQALAGDGGSLRYGLELAVTGMEEAASAITNLQKAFALGQFDQANGAMMEIGKFVDTAAWSFKTLGNAVIASGIALSKFGKAAVEAMPNVKEIAKQALALSPLGGAAKAIEQAGNSFGNLWKKGYVDGITNPEYRKKMTDAVAQDWFPETKDYIGDAMKPLSEAWAKWQQETQERINKLHSAASKAQGKIAQPEGDASDPAAKKKAADDLERQRKSLAEIVHEYARQGEVYGEITAKQKILNEQKEQEYKISKLINVPLKERLAAIEEIAAITKQKLEKERLDGIAKEKKGLKELLDDMQRQLQSDKDRNDAQEELIPLLEAEAKIREITKNYAGESLDLQRQIRDLAQKQSEQIVADRHEKALKTLKEITDEWQEQTDILERQLSGQDQLNKLLEAEKKIRETKGLTDDEKDAAIKSIREQDEKAKSLNKTLAAHKKVIDDITNSGLSHKKQVEALELAYKNDAITAKEWADAMNDITKESTKAQSAAGTFASALTGAMDKFISGGTKAKNIVTDLGKEMLKVASKTLLTDPLQKGLTGLLAKLFGGGGSSKLPQAPSFLPPGVNWGLNPYTGQPSYNYTGNTGGTGTAGGSLPAFQPMAGIANTPGLMPAAMNGLMSLFNKMGGPQIMQQYPWAGKLGMGLGSVAALGASGLTGGLPSIFNTIGMLPQAWGLVSNMMGIGGGGNMPQSNPMGGGFGGGFGGLGSGLLSLLMPGYASMNALPQTIGMLNSGFSGLGGFLGGLNPLSLLTKQFLPIAPGQKMSLGGYGLQFLKALLPGFASGGMASANQPFIAGEDGEELIWPTQNMQVFNARQTEQMMPYIGNWVPEARAQGIRDAGIDPEMYEMKRLNDYALAHPEARADTMKKYYEAMDRWGMKGNQYEAEAKELAEQHMKNNARQLFNENPGPGSGGFGLAQQIAGSVLANQSQSIIGLRMGKLMLNAGNALETIDSMGGASEGFRRYASSSDWLSQWSYDPDTVFDPKGFGFSYKSMGIGGNNRDATAYGGDGHQAAMGDYLAERGDQLALASANKYANIMKNYTGQHFIGGGPNIISTGLGVNGTGRGPIVQPHYDNREWPLPPSAHVPTQDELMEGNRAEAKWYFDKYGYWPKSGNLNGWHRHADEVRGFDTVPGRYDRKNENPNQLTPVDYQNQYGKYKGFTAAAYPAIMGMVENLPEIKYNGRPLGGSVSPSMMSYQLSGELFNNEAPSNGASAYGHWATGPMEAGAIHAKMQYGGARAQGGRAEKNTMYKVLERGDEMFIPDSPGRIVPLSGKAFDGIGGGGANVRVFPAPGVETQVVQNGRDISVFQNARMANDMSNGQVGKHMQSIFGMKPVSRRRG